ncbi:unnamed protein product [Clonostachys solani]|uniref:Major facilitator superfamily (MFS) profile domain-containing protein n=1 Tax=Clonostachys solani TaxID=160281 RepID=A0A9P0EGX2_9HYPO|nr:unnamed protein product [Clonostachys solani]
MASPPETKVKTAEANREVSDTEASSGYEEEIHTEPIKTWKGQIWDTLELPPAQRKLLGKVDAVVLTFASLGYFLKYLDQNNINNAFLSGMKEELNMYGNELVTSTSIWTVGYVIGQIPINLLLTRVSPRWVIPSLEVGWGIATFATSSVKSYQALYALRFLVGFFESGFYPGMHYLLGSWYTPREIGKRGMIFWLFGTVGTMFSGFLQSAAYTNLNGVAGRSGWRWLFIIDGIITIPVAVAGWIFFPNLPQDNKKTWWLTDSEQVLAKRRMAAVGRAGRQPWSKAKILRIAKSWHTWTLPFVYVIWNNAGLQAPMGYWLKSFNANPPPVPGTSFTVPEINNLPLPTNGIFIVMALIWAWLSDGPCKGRRWPFIYAGAVIAFVLNITLLEMPLYSNIKGRMALYWLSNVGNGAGPLILSWINEICSADTEKRALLVAAANDLAYVVQAVAPNFVWKTTDFPLAKKGFIWSTVLQVLLVLITALVQILLWRDRRKESHLPVAAPESDPDLAVREASEDSKKVAVERTKAVDIA